MTQAQKDQIKKYRVDGVGYTAISRLMGLPLNTVKSFCKRNNLGGRLAVSVKADKSEGSALPAFCKRCGLPIEQTLGRKVKVFCSTACRMQWWKVHPENLNRKAVYGFTCGLCGKPFTAYGNKNRKFCSHDCYVAARFGKAVTP